MVKFCGTLLAVALLLAGCGPQTGAQALRQGEIAYETNDDAAALEAFRAASHARDLTREERIHAFVMRGRIYMRGHGYREALGQFNYALKLAPGRPDILRERGLARAILGDLNGAIGDYDLALAVDPDDALVRRQRGDALFDTGNTKKALADYDAALKAFPDDALALAHRALARAKAGGQGAAARSDITRAVNLAKEESWPQLIRVQVYFDSGAAPEALKTLDDMIARDPRDVRALHWRAWLNLDLKDFTAARRDLDAALALEPDNPRLHLLLAEFYRRQHDERGAIKALSDALPVLEGDIKADALFQRAGLYFALEKFDAAATDYTAVLAIRPKDALALGNRCWTHVRRNQLAAARADCDAARRLTPDDPFILHSLAAILEQLGETKEAAKYYREAALRDPSNLAFVYDAVRTGSGDALSHEAVGVDVNRDANRARSANP